MLQAPTTNSVVPAHQYTASSLKRVSIVLALVPHYIHYRREGFLCVALFSTLYVLAYLKSTVKWKIQILNCQAASELIRKYSISG